VIHDITVQKTETQTLYGKSKLALNRSTEVKILRRGDYYLTPFTLGHVEEVAENLSPENKRELLLLGHTDIKQALHEMHDTADSYLCRRNDETFLMVGGLWYNDDRESPQMFSMFSDGLKQNFHALARGSKLLVNFFDKSETYMSMTILADYEGMLNWAAWLGFEAVGIHQVDANKYVDFVRCNPNEKIVYNKALRPVTH
jgi:hypothetical protein